MGAANLNEHRGLQVRVACEGDRQVLAEELLVVEAESTLDAGTSELGKIQAVLGTQIAARSRGGREVPSRRSRRKGSWLTRRAWKPTAATGIGEPGTGT